MTMKKWKHQLWLFAFNKRSFCSTFVWQPTNNSCTYKFKACLKINTWLSPKSQSFVSHNVVDTFPRSSLQTKNREIYWVADVAVSDTLRIRQILYWHSFFLCVYVRALKIVLWPTSRFPIFHTWQHGAATKIVSWLRTININWLHLWMCIQI